MPLMAPAGRWQRGRATRPRRPTSATMRRGASASPGPYGRASDGQQSLGGTLRLEHEVGLARGGWSRWRGPRGSRRAARRTCCSRRHGQAAGRERCRCRPARSRYRAGWFRRRPLSAAAGDAGRRSGGGKPHPGPGEADGDPHEDDEVAKDQKPHPQAQATAKRVGEDGGIEVLHQRVGEGGQAEDECRPRHRAGQGSGVVRDQSDHEDRRHQHEHRESIQIHRRPVTRGGSHVGEAHRSQDQEHPEVDHDPGGMEGQGAVRRADPHGSCCPAEARARHGAGSVLTRRRRHAIPFLPRWPRSPILSSSSSP
jgi:hypothetical protein